MIGGFVLLLLPTRGGTYLPVAADLVQVSGQYRHLLKLLFCAVEFLVWMIHRWDRLVISGRVFVFGVCIVLLMKMCLHLCHVFRYRL